MIEIEGLPEGFEINSVTINAGETISQCFNTIQATIHLKKIKPRRIVLEETDIDAGLDWNDSIYLDDIVINIQSCKNWKIVEDGK